MAAGIMQSIDDKVDEDFLFFLEHYNEAFNSLRSQSDKEICNVRTIYLPFEYFDFLNINYTICMCIFVEMVR